MPLPVVGAGDRPGVFAEEVGIGVDVDGVGVAEFDEPCQSMADLLCVEVEAFAQVMVGVDERLGDFLGFGAGDVIGVAEVSGEVVPDEDGFFDEIEHGGGGGPGAENLNFGGQLMAGGFDRRRSATCCRVTLAASRMAARASCRPV